MYTPSTNFIIVQERINLIKLYSAVQCDTIVETSSLKLEKNVT